MLVRAAGSSGLRIVRRCIDAVELLAAARADGAVPVILSAGLPRLTVGLVDDLRAGRSIVGLASDEEQRRLLQGLGVLSVVSVDGDPERTMAVVSRRLRDTGVAPAAAETAPSDGDEAIPPPGGLIAVWGPQGAPGRTTVAIGVAGALARQGLRVCLVDADTYAPSAAMALGVVADVSGLVVACHRADLDSASPESIGALAIPAGDRLSILTGLTEPAQWSDLRGRACPVLWSHLRAAFDACVVDTGFCLDPPEEGQWSRPRNAAGRSAVECADRVIAVAEGSAMGAARLVAAWPHARSLAGGRVQVVRNRVARRAALPSSRAWGHAIRSGGIDADVREIPDDPKAVRRAWDQARTPNEVAPRSRLSQALDGLAAGLRLSPARVGLTTRLVAG